MNSRDFVYWLQGFFELSGDIDLINGEQLDLIKRHLAMVFVHEIDPSFGAILPVLQEIHDDTKQPDRPIPPCVDHMKFTC